MQGREFDVAIQVLLFAVLITAATTDLRSRTIHNWTTYPGIAFGLALGYCAGDTPAHCVQSLENHLLGLLVGGGILWLAWLSGGVKGGDWKLMAAIGAIKGFPFIMYALWYSSLFGCAFALAFLVYHGRLLKGLGHSVKKALWITTPAVSDDDPVKRRIQFGVAIAFGTMLAWGLDVMSNPRPGGLP